MKKAYEVCPICGGELTAFKQINDQCLIVGKRLSFITNSCYSYDNFAVKRDHDFYQIQSLYGDLYVEKFVDRERSTGVIVDHVNCNTKFVGKFNNRIDEVMAEYNKVVDMDYPNLTNIRRKLKTLSIFL